ncbi:hypothetical protein EVAR_26073_1 [Eumeta japonica]|uniref:Uncharacterized protein n=1 Tax=Eumeta variegata TaxID=151549 RepID=A0A4C1VRH2_EUMVA|nr:hypothetical protein EVAR_26073_1 [Eumeta japonica]
MERMRKIFRAIIYYNFCRESSPEECLAEVIVDRNFATLKHLFVFAFADAAPPRFIFRRFVRQLADPAPGARDTVGSPASRPRLRPRSPSK